MKILSFSYCFPNQASPTWGIFVQHRLVAMSNQADVRVVSPSAWFPMTSRRRGGPGPSQEFRHGLQIYRPRFFCVPKFFKSLDGRLYGRSLTPWLQNLAAQWQPELLDAHFIWPDGVGVAYLASRFHLPYSITLRGKLHPCLEIPAQRCECVDALTKADQVISVDPRMAQIAEDLGVSADRIKVIPNGVDTQRFAPGDRAEARRELQLPSSCKLIVTVAHLGRRKGHHETIEALASLPQDVSLVLVGGPSVSGEDDSQLTKLAEQYGVADRLIIVGKQPQEMIPKFYQAADVTVLASWREGCPNTVLESLACGTPVVATDVGAVPEMIDDGVNGRVVPVRNAERLGIAIRDVLEQPPSPQLVRASKSVRPWNAVANDVVDAFSQLVRADETLPNAGISRMAAGQGLQ